MSYRKYNLVTITPTLYAAGAIDAGKILFDTVKLPNVCPRNGASLIRSITILDKDLLDINVDIVFLKKSTSLGSLGVVPTITDADAAATFQGIITVPATTRDFGNASSLLTNLNTGLIVESDPDEADTGAIYIAGLAVGTETHTASGLTINIGFEIP